MRKNILFMVINMNIGGTEKALLNMIAEIPKEQFKITILMLENQGGFIKSIPNHVNYEIVKEYESIKEDIQKPPIQIIVNKIKSFEILSAINIMFFYFISKLFKQRSNYLDYFLKKLPHFKGEYDLAVAYAGPMDLISLFIEKKVNAKKKVQWIHFDINKIGFSKNFASKYYVLFDRVFIVSKEGRNKLIKNIPKLKEKTEVFYNVTSPLLIKKQAKEGKTYQDEFDGIRILTVGRLSYEKGQDIAIRTLAKLIKNGFNVKWYFVGGGHIQKEYEFLARELNVIEHLIFLGEEPNPYSYMKNCDIYVQPSRHEGYCITLAEVKILHKPIVTTNFTGANEQIIHNETGLIVNIDHSDIYIAIRKLIENPLLRKRISRKLELIAANKTDISQLYELL